MNMGRVIIIWNTRSVQPSIFLINEHLLQRDATHSSNSTFRPTIICLMRTFSIAIEESVYYDFNCIWSAI